MQTKINETGTSTRRTILFKENETHPSFHCECGGFWLRTIHSNWISWEKKWSEREREKQWQFCCHLVCLNCWPPTYRCACCSEWFFLLSTTDNVRNHTKTLLFKVLMLLSNNISSRLISVEWCEEKHETAKEVLNKLLSFFNSFVRRREFTLQQTRLHIYYSPLAPSTYQHHWELLCVAGNACWITSNSDGPQQTHSKWESYDDWSDLNETN